MQAIILAGGKATRLQTVLKDIPKALASIRNKPFLDYLLQFLNEQGVHHFIFSLGHQHQQLLDYLQAKEKTWTYTCVIEEQALGTGGAIKKALPFATDQHVWVINADTYLELNMRTMYQQHINNKAMATIALKEMEHFDRYGLVNMDDRQCIYSFEEKRSCEKGLINAGFFIVNKDRFLENAPSSEVFSVEKDFFELQLFNKAIYGFKTDGFFIDIGIPEDFEKAQQLLPNL
ncbi:MAG: nucleotidyltransferase family protein [Bacteroidota bacterium]|nr:nucleotidyltransferase family protein [Bacteroidota bacterium]